MAKKLNESPKLVKMTPSSKLLITAFNLKLTVKYLEFDNDFNDKLYDCTFAENIENFDQGSKIKTDSKNKTSSSHLLNSQKHSKGMPAVYNRLYKNPRSKAYY